jgi:HAD superfamily hydrolase (TIGR01509 family)
MSDLSRIAGRTRHLLLDFDGPICSVFAGMPAPTVASQLRDLLYVEGITLSPEVAQAQDPLAVLRHVGGLGEKWAQRIEAALRRAEVAAVHTAEPTPQAREVMEACWTTGRTVAVVSNNSRAAVETYLAAHDLAQYVEVISARTEPDPAFMKPGPHLITQALSRLGADQGECTLVGDSVTDIHSAEAAGIRSIGFANKPGKRERLTRSGADAIITNMTELAQALANTHVLPA